METLGSQAKSHNSLNVKIPINATVKIPTHLTLTVKPRKIPTNNRVLHQSYPKLLDFNWKIYTVFYTLKILYKPKQMQLQRKSEKNQEG